MEYLTNPFFWTTITLVFINLAQYIHNKKISTDNRIPIVKIEISTSNSEQFHASLTAINYDSYSMFIKRITTKYKYIKITNKTKRNSQSYELEIDDKALSDSIVTNKKVPPGSESSLTFYIVKLKQDINDNIKIITLISSDRKGFYGKQKLWKLKQNVNLKTKTSQ